MPRPRTRVPTLLAVPLLALLAACGGGQATTTKIVAASPAVPEDLCSLLPQQLVGSLQTSATNDPTGQPTSSCSLVSAPGTTPAVRDLVTMIHFDDADLASQVYESQCRALDKVTSQVSTSLPVQGGQKACGSEARSGDVATLNVLRGNDVLTARASSTPAGSPSALARSTSLAAAVLQASGTTAPASPSS